MSWASEEPTSPPEPRQYAQGCPGCGSATKDDCICGICPGCGVRVEGQEDALCGACQDDHDAEAEQAANLDALNWLVNETADGMARRRQAERAATFNADEMYGTQEAQGE